MPGSFLPPQTKEEKNKFGFSNGWGQSLASCVARDPLIHDLSSSSDFKFRTRDYWYVKWKLEVNLEWPKSSAPDCSSLESGQICDDLFSILNEKQLRKPKKLKNWGIEHETDRIIAGSENRGCKVSNGKSRRAKKLLKVKKIRRQFFAKKVSKLDFGDAMVEWPARFAASRVWFQLGRKDKT